MGLKFSAGLEASHYLIDGNLQVARLLEKLAADVDVCCARVHGAAGNKTALNEHVWVVAHDLAVLKLDKQEKGGGGRREIKEDKRRARTEAITTTTTTRSGRVHESNQQDVVFATIEEHAQQNTSQHAHTTKHTPCKCLARPHRH